MRKMTILAAGAALAFATAASAQQNPAPTPAEPSRSAAPAAPSAAPAIKTISVVEIEQLPEATKARVEAIVAKRSDADLQKLRGSIDATPAAKSALEAQGLTSAAVVAASMGSDGALTLITKKDG
jgi:hypothetical protein